MYSYSSNSVLIRDLVEAILVICITLVAALFASFAQYLFKRAMPKFRFRLPELIALLKDRTIIAGIIIYFIGLAIYLVALEKGQLSFVYPIFASSFIFIMLISRFMLNEKLTGMRILGILLVFAGVVMISLTY
ncbi:MAG: EamA family transporter [Candidatus Micrarchaeaceae archaeon]